MSAATNNAWTAFPWLGRPPTNWRLRPLKHELRFDVGWTPPTGNAASFEGENLWVTIGDMDSETITDTQSRISDDAVKSSGIRICPVGSLLYSFKLSVGKVAFAGVELYTNEAIASFHPLQKADLRFFYYALPDYLWRYSEENIYGAKLLNQERIKNARLAIPPSAEQRRIAAYLDEQTGKIDRLMDMRQRQMALLKEQRAALIQQAVTRGLNPSAPMKDSGLAWLGEIPAHWGVKKLKFLCSTTKGFAFKSELFVDEGVPVVRASEIKDFSVVACGTFIQSDIALNFLQVTLRTGDILISTVGSKAEILDSAVGQVGVVPPALDGALLNQNTVRLELASPKEVSQNFIFNLLRTDTYRKHLDIHAHGTANQASLSLVDILSFSAPLPPLAEQISIVEFIDCQCQQIDRTIDGYAHQLTLLAEYRAALIHECVTGQRTMPEAASA